MTSQIFLCPNCRGPMQVDQEYINTLVTCPSCNEIVKVGLQDAYAPPASNAPVTPQQTQAPAAPPQQQMPAPPPQHDFSNIPPQPDFPATPQPPVYPTSSPTTVANTSRRKHTAGKKKLGQLPRLALLLLVGAIILTTVAYQKGFIGGKKKDQDQDQQDKQSQRISDYSWA